MSDNGNNGNVTSMAHAPVKDEDLGQSGKTAKLKIFRGDSGGGELVDTTAVVCHPRCRNDPGRNHG